MDRWFEKKFERNDLREHTLRRIGNDSWIAKVYRTFSITHWIILINIFVYIIITILLITGVSEETILSYVGLKAHDFFAGKIWTVFTSMMVHIWLPHLFFNMISLFFVGSFLEKIIGRKKFIFFYVSSGIFAGFFYVVLSYLFGNSIFGARIFMNPNVFAVGASGAIFGIAGLLAVLTPFMRVYLIAGPILAIILQSILSSLYPNLSGLSLLNLLFTLYIFISLFSMFSFNSTIRKISIPLGMHLWFLPIAAIVPLFIIGLFVDLPIGNTAHFGGLLAGIVYGYYLKNKYRRKTDLLRKMFQSEGVNL